MIDRRFLKRVAAAELVRQAVRAVLRWVRRLRGES